MTTIQVGKADLPVLEFLYHYICVYQDVYVQDCNLNQVAALLRFIHDNSRIIKS